MIEFKNVFIKHINEFYTLYDFNKTINRNTLFVGDFYAGTNSIMRLLSKIDKDYTGEILINNNSLKTIKTKDLNLSYLPQNPCIFKCKSVFYNLYYPLKLKKIPKNTAKTTINTLLNDLKLDFLNKKIRKMNNSELKILCLIRALLKEPQYVLLENLFEDLNPENISTAYKILSMFNENTLFIACEKNLVANEFFKDFEVFELNKSKEKKEV